jgi:hypothetical protein
MLIRRSNRKLALGILIGAVVGVAAANYVGGRQAAAQSDDGRGKSLGIAIFKDPEQLGSLPYAYILYDSGKVDRKPLKSLAGG